MWLFTLQRKRCSQLGIMATFQPTEMDDIQWYKYNFFFPGKTWLQFGLMSDNRSKASRMSSLIKLHLHYRPIIKAFHSIILANVSYSKSWILMRHWITFIVLPFSPLYQHNVENEKKKHSILISITSMVLKSKIEKWHIHLFKLMCSGPKVGKKRSGVR